MLSLWDVARQAVKARLKVPPGEPEAPCEVSDDGQWVALTSSGESKLYALVWNTPAPEPKKIFFAENRENTQALSISPDGRFLACSHGSDGLILLDLHESLPRPLIREHEVEAACFSGDGRFLVYYSLSGHVRLWSVSRHQEVADLAHPLKSGQGEDYLATFSADGNTFATAQGRSHSVRIWKLAGSGEKLVLSGHDGQIPCVAFSPDGKVLASGSHDHLVKLWDTATGRLLRTLPRFDSAIQSIAFSPDGRHLATGKGGPTSQPVQVWDLATLQANALPDDELGRGAYGVAFSPDGKFLAACGNGLTLWRVAEGERGAGTRCACHSNAWPICQGKDRCTFASVPTANFWPGWIAITRSAFGTWRKRARSRSRGRRCEHGWHNLAFYPDSDHLTFSTARGMLEIWDTRTARRVSSFAGKGVQIAASPDGRWLMDAKLTLWSSQTGTRVFSLPQGGLTGAVALSPDGEHLAVGQADGGLVIWSVPKIQAQLARIGLAWRPDARPQAAAGAPAFRAHDARGAEPPGGAIHEPGDSLGFGGPASRGGGGVSHGAGARPEKLVDGQLRRKRLPQQCGNRPTTPSASYCCGQANRRRRRPSSARRCRSSRSWPMTIRQSRPSASTSRLSTTTSSLQSARWAGRPRPVTAATGRSSWPSGWSRRARRTRRTAARLARSLRHRSLARRDLGDAPGQRPMRGAALGLYEGLPSRSGEQWFETACCHAALCGLSGHDGAAVSAAEGEQEAARAMGALTRAATLGFRDAHSGGPTRPWPRSARATTSGP